MRKLFIIIICLFVVAGTQAQNELPKLPNSTFYFEPMFFFVSTFEIGIEKDLKNRTKALSLSLGVLLDENGSRSDPESGAEFLKGVNGQISYKIYVTNNIEQGAKHDRLSSFYFSPFLKYNYTSNTYSFTQWIPDSIGYWQTISIIDQISSISGGVLLGLRIILVDRMAFDFYFGGGAKLSQISGNEAKYNRNIFSVGYTGVLPRFGLKFGFLF